METTLLNLLWNPDFYKQWHFWLLLALLFLHIECQFIGFQISRISGLDRRKIGAVYANEIWVRAIIAIAMVLTSSLLPTLGGICVILAVVVCTHTLARHCAFLLVLNHLGFREPEMQAFIDSHTRPLP